LIFEREPSRQALINRGCRRINVAQSLADLYAITRQSIRTDRRLLLASASLVHAVRDSRIGRIEIARHRA
jgi:hypothetical protein